MIRFLLICFILLSSIMHTLGEEDSGQILSRITLADVFGLAALSIGLITLFKILIYDKLSSRIFKAGIFMLMCFFLPIMYSYKPEKTIFEIIIILFLVLICIYTVYFFKDKFLNVFIPVIIYTAILTCVFGLYDMIATAFGMTTIFKSRARGEVLGSFRNAGQAGAYILVIITILYPIYISKLKNELSRWNRIMLIIAITLSFLFLLLTAKIAAYIGLFIGVLGFAISQRNTKTVFSLIIFSFITSMLYLNLETIAPDVYNRINIKYESRVQDRLSGEKEMDAGFMGENYRAAIQSFNNRPLIGTGLAGFIGTYHTHEVHSTYFKMIGETGLIGVLGYIVFMSVFLSHFKYRKFRRTDNPYADYLYAMLPFVFGCMISWGYTYHLRKREFWILVAVVLIAVYQFHKYNDSILVSDERNNL